MNKTIHIDEIEKLLFECDESANSIARGANMYPTEISRLRRKTSKLENLSLKVALKLQNYINEKYK